MKRNNYHHTEITGVPDCVYACTASYTCACVMGGNYIYVTTPY